MILTPASALVGLVLSIASVAAFGAAALALAAMRYTARSSKSPTPHMSTHDFIAARNTQPATTIAWSFYAAAMGSWVLYSPAQFVADPEVGAGFLGIIAYALSTGLPIIIVATMGTYIRRNIPEATSITSFSRWRFGPVVEIFTAVLVLFNISIALLAEYTAIGQVFLDFFGVAPLVPILVIGVVTTIYTVAGGLAVSIITDQWQAIFSILLVMASAVILGTSYHDVVLPPIPDRLAATPLGIQSLPTLGIAMVSANFFSDAMWQRVWASADDTALRIGAFLGAGLAMTVVAFFSFGSLLAYWSGRATPTDNSALGFFLAFRNADGSIPPVIAILVVLFATTMNESAVDSFQNAITDTIVSVTTSILTPCGMPPIHINTARIIVVITNIPIMVIALQGYSIISLFLIANMVATCCFFPLALGFIPAFYTIISGITVMLSSATALIAVITWAAFDQHSIQAGLHMYFFTVYDYRAFLIAVAVSITACFVFGVVEIGVRRMLKYPKISMPSPSLSSS